MRQTGSKPGPAGILPAVAKGDSMVTIQLTHEELENLIKFHNLRRSETCEEASVGYAVANKLTAAHAQFHIAPTRGC